jgi:hypothetical protein
MNNEFERKWIEAVIAKCNTDQYFNGIFLEDLRKTIKTKGRLVSMLIFEPQTSCQLA